MSKETNSGYSFKISPRPHPEDSAFCKNPLSDNFTFTVSKYPTMPVKDDLFVMNHLSLVKHTGGRQVVLKVLWRVHRMGGKSVDLLAYERKQRF